MRVSLEADSKIKQNLLTLASLAEALNQIRRLIPYTVDLGANR